MFPQEVKNSDLEAHYNVTISDDIYAVDAKGHRKFLTDLRVLYAREMTNAKTALHKKEENKKALTEMAQDLFVELDRSFPDYEIIMRKSQPGLELKDLGLKIYCIASLNGRHIASCTSKVYDKEFLEEAFSNHKFYDKKEYNGKAITIPTNSFEDLVSVINRMIMIHSI